MNRVKLLVATAAAALSLWAVVPSPAAAGDYYVIEWVDSHGHYCYDIVYLSDGHITSVCFTGDGGSHATDAQAVS